MERFYWTQKDELMQRRFEKRESEIKICMHLLGIERRTYFYWLREILEVAFMWANNLKLLQ